MTGPQEQLLYRILVTDPVELLGLLRAGGSLVYSHAEGWSLVGSGAGVSDMAIAVLVGRASLLVDNGAGQMVALDLAGGCLVPCGDTLPGLDECVSQTYVWVEGGSRTIH